MWGARLRRFLFVGGPLVLLVFLTWFLLPAHINLPIIIAMMDGIC